jgi:hypothetical protein
VSYVVGYGSFELGADRWRRRLQNPAPASVFQSMNLPAGQNERRRRAHGPDRRE